MATTYITKTGDMLDEIAKTYYGTLAGRIVEQVLDANTGLAEYGPILPHGVSINLPDIKPSSSNEEIMLWG